MLPGYLHFDVRRGVTADMLNAAMSAFADMAVIRAAFASLELFGIEIVVNEAVRHGIKGRVVHFYIDGGLVSLEISSTKPIYTEKTLADSPQHELVLACLRGERIEIARLRTVFLKKGVRPTLSGLAIKILEELQSSMPNEPSLIGAQALWLLCHLSLLVAQVDALDPKFITASNLTIQPSSAVENVPLRQSSWINRVATRLPINETYDGAETDVLALAFLKSLTGHFGARGKGSILHVSSGFSASGQAGLVEALWCEAHLPPSIQEVGPRNALRVSSLFLVRGFVPASLDVHHVSSSLSHSGAASVCWHLAHGDKHTSFYRVEFLCFEDHKKDLIEAFLIKGEAKDVFITEVERHELNRRLVSIPVGSGNKTSSIRFYEYIYYDKTLRVEPLPEDLDRYALASQHSIDVARSDLLLMWKKWRGRVSLEDA